MPDDPLATELATICEQASLPDDRSYDALMAHAAASEEGIARLVAAVDAILAQHQPGPVVVLGALCPRHEAHRHFSITSAEVADVTACPDCPATVYVSCAGCGRPVRLDSCPARSAITRALTGEDTPDA